MVWRSRSKSAIAAPARFRKNWVSTVKRSATLVCSRQETKRGQSSTPLTCHHQSQARHSTRNRSPFHAQDLGSPPPEHPQTPSQSPPSSINMHR